MGDLVDLLRRSTGRGLQNIQYAMPEALRNYVGKAEWDEKKNAQDFYGGDFEAQERADKMMGFGTDAAGLVGAIKASHGTPHRFDRFSMDKIGTGEGAQAYGHGMYFAQGFDSPVAQKYAEDLSNIDRNTGLASSHMNARNQVARFGNDPEWAAEVIADTMRNFDPKDNQYKALEDTLKFIKSGEYAKPLQSEGHLYNVELKWPDAAKEASDPLGEHHLLDWDKEFVKQSPYVKQILKENGLMKEYRQNLSDFSTPQASRNKLARGQNIQAYLEHRLGSEAAVSDYLRQQGIPGLKYLDGNSRDSGRGSRNYVIFDDAIPEIVTRNGEAVAKALRGAK